MLTIENTEVFGFEAAIRGMRNPMNSWDQSDSKFTCKECDGCAWELEAHIDIYENEWEETKTSWCPHSPLRVGENDMKLMKNLAKAGSDHAKYLRMINVTVDITAPLYWWKEFDTYKVGTVANSCSTMHKIHSKEFTMDDFSTEHLNGDSLYTLKQVIVALNRNRQEFINFDETDPVRTDLCGENKKDYWWQMIQLLPSSYNQKRTVQLNYEVLRKMYFARRNHKLDCWHTLCDWMLTLPYFKELCVDVVENS